MPPYHWENPPSAEWDEGEKLVTMKRKLALDEHPVCMFHDCDGHCPSRDRWCSYITRCEACGQEWRLEDQNLLRVIKRMPS